MTAGAWSADRSADAGHASAEHATLDPRTREALAELLLTLADDEFVIGFWDSEWTGIAPMLEEDVATSSIAQDEIGHAKALYELLAEVTDDDADRIAYAREPAAFRHAPLLDHRRSDWAFTVMRRYLYETADAVRLESLARSSFAPLAGLATKMRREETYHLMHWEVWLRRLAAGSGEARGRLEAAFARLWPEAGSVLAPLSGEEALIAGGILPEPMQALRARWLERILPELRQHGLAVDPVPQAIPREARSRHSPDFDWLHGEFTSVARLEEGATW
jgi:ring-1,2-phenylacetyl-CoA epoxidase subunit PaaC